ncbi:MULTISPECIES: ribbon-helix-helix domain-containing protein [Mumia]|uniref:ribbon-helix-helix domain-containing protein n=1 Tax=Mumia TaxID=1546255 RepID=UPI001422E4F6|nr:MULTISPECIES: ribbon-helix-helix domain-containing protein [unclassified Mumia]QMW67096.1 ribbon-helix-helix protein, CopG family [Mumia sp. ZJ1417]
MKTAISIPDPLFARIDAKAAEQGLSRSAFFATAAERYLDELSHDDLTRRIDVFFATEGTDPRDAVVVEYGRARLAADAEGW